MELLQSNLEDRIYFNLDDFLVDLKHLFALCPPILADKINEKVSYNIFFIIILCFT